MLSNAEHACQFYNRISLYLCLPVLVQMHKVEKHIVPFAKLTSAQGAEHECEPSRLKNGGQGNSIFPRTKQPFQKWPEAEHQAHTASNL